MMLTKKALLLEEDLRMQNILISIAASCSLFMNIMNEVTEQ